MRLLKILARCVTVRVLPLYTNINAGRQQLFPEKIHRAIRAGKNYLCI